MLADRILSWESAWSCQDSRILAGVAVAGQGQGQRIIQRSGGNAVRVAPKVSTDLLPVTPAEASLPVLQISCGGTGPDGAQLNNRRVAQPTSMHRGAPTASKSVTAIAAAARYPAYTVAVSTGRLLELIRHITTTTNATTTMGAMSEKVVRRDNLTKVILLAEARPS